jgi:hypothetical protein
MRRGTRVAQAYVAITADGSGINEEIVNSVDEAGPDVERAGDEAGDRYGERFSARFRERMEGMRSKVADRLGVTLGQAGDKAGGEAGERAGQSFVDRVSEKVRNVGDKIGEELSDRIASRPEQVRRGIDRAFDDDFAERIGRRLGESMAKSLADVMEPVLADVGKKAAAAATPSVSGNRRQPSLGDRVGGALGAGSRNNAFNALGRGVGGITDLLTGIPKLLGKIKDASGGLFKEIQTGFINAQAKGGDFAGLLGGAGAGISKIFGSLAASGPAAAAAIAAVAISMTFLVSIVNALLAAIAALAATIASALVGALAVGSAGFVALAAAGGLATLAFMSMNNEQKKLLSEAFRPLHQEAIGLGQTMITQMVPAFAAWSNNLQRALALATPLAAVMGGAFARAGTILTASLSGPGVMMLINMLSITLPGIVTSLSTAFGGFLNGLAAMFAAIMPQVLIFSDYLARVAQSFSNWATSAQGQNAIVDFVNRALTSLESLWNFMKAVGGLIVAVFFSSEAQGAGNSIFDSMAKAVRRFTDYIQQDNRMQKWFAEGVAFAQALGETIVTVTKALQTLNNSGVIDGIAVLADAAASAYSWFDKLGGSISGLLGPLGSAISSAQRLGDLVGMIPGLGGGGGSSAPRRATPSGNVYSSSDTTMAEQAKTNRSTSSSPGPSSSLGQTVEQIMASLQSSGASALGSTYQSSGGYVPNPASSARRTPKYHNPYVKFANSLIKQGPGIAAQIRNAILTVNKQVVNAIADATRATSADQVAQTLNSQIVNMTTSAQQTVNTAQQALNSAATRLANAGSKKEAKAALKEVRRQQRNLAAAQRDQRRINSANRILAAQEIVKSANVSRLVAGVKTTNVTLAELAQARSIIADRLDVANQKLADAIALRDQYRQQVTDGIKQFGSIMNAQAQTINGVQQALTAGDITSTLQDRLTRIQHFQDTLQKLLGMGLSNDLYKQLVDAGVEQGSAYADALLSGGVGSIQQANGLTSAINSAANSLGLEASNRLYQAGVDAAKGLVDGLNAQAAQLDAAATWLGNSIAAAVKKALGIKSPSRVLMGMMDYVGDGAVIGLDNQGNKVDSAANRFASRIAVSPEVAAYAQSQGQSPVSGNGGHDIDVTIITPTEDPHAVAMEAVNEIVGRL